MRTLAIVTVALIGLFSNVAVAESNGIATQNQPLQTATPVSGIDQKEPSFIDSSSLNNLINRSCQPTKPNAAKAPIPDEIIELHDAWLSYSHKWRSWYYILGIGTVIFAAFAASGVFKDDMKTRYGTIHFKSMVALIATILAGTSALLEPQKNYRNFDEAWVMLNTAKLIYLTNDRATLCELAHVVYDAERLIHS